jgi:hypothetical protein
VRPIPRRFAIAPIPWFRNDRTKAAFMDISGFGTIDLLVLPLTTNVGFERCYSSAKSASLGGQVFGTLK